MKKRAFKAKRSQPVAAKASSAPLPLIGTGRKTSLLAQTSSQKRAETTRASKPAPNQRLLAKDGVARYVPHSTSRSPDHGAGLPPGFDWQQASTLGLSMVNMLARQMHGSVEVSHNGGIEFRVTFAVAEEVSPLPL